MVNKMSNNTNNFKDANTNIDKENLSFKDYIGHLIENEITVGEIDFETIQKIENELSHRLDCYDVLNEELDHEKEKEYLDKWEEHHENLDRLFNYYKEFKNECSNEDKIIKKIEYCDYDAEDVMFEEGYYFDAEDVER